MKPLKASQISGDLFVSASETSNQNLPDAFKRIYYHLYTNSKASRAETIIEDLSLLLLSKLASDHSGNDNALKKFIAGDLTSTESLIPVLAKAFPKLLGKGQRFTLGDSSLRSALSEMEGMDLSHAPAHLIGEAFQALIGPRLRGEKGQFFTPKSLVRAMVEIIAPQPNESVLDPASGTGGFLAEAYLYQSKTFPDQTCNGSLVGVDKDTGLARLGGSLLTLLCKDRGAVFNFNSLDPAEWISNFGKDPTAKFDVILTNPPFGAKIGVKDEKLLAGYDFGYVWTSSSPKGNWLKTNAISASEDPQVLFLELCVRALKPGGRLGIVLPEGMFGNKQTSYVWGWLRERGEVLGLLDCPRTTFQPGTDTKTNVLFFRKNDQKNTERQKKTRVAVALNCGHDRRGRSTKTNGENHPDDFLLIAKQYRLKNEASEMWRDVSLLDAEYVVPRYHFYKADKIISEQGIAAGAKLITLGELVKQKIITIRKGHEVGSDAYGTGEIPFIRTSDLSNFEVSSDPTKSVSIEIYEEYALQQNLQPGDILMVVDGRYRIGTTAMLDEHSIRSIAQSHLRIISVVDREKLDPYELLFALNIPSVKLRLRGLVFIQSTLGTLGSRLLELKIPILHGEGPWSERVRLFRDSLQQRALQLAALKGMSAPEIEL